MCAERMLGSSGLGLLSKATANAMNAIVSWKQGGDRGEGMGQEGAWDRSVSAQLPEALGSVTRG